MKKLSAFFLHFVLFALLARGLAGAEPATLAPGQGRFEFKREGKTIPVWYYLPADAKPDTPVLVVMHGVNRDADRYRNEWTPHAQKYGFILVAPEFSKTEFPGDDGYNFGGTVDGQGHALPQEKWAFSFIEPIFDAVKAATGNRSAKYNLYGHSAGAQFVHRYLYFVPDARVANVVAANAGWWTLPDETVGFPYGLRGSVVTSAALKTMLQRPLVVLLGTADTDPNAANLRQTPEARAQGPFRLARGNYFFSYGQRQAAAMGVPLGWTLATAPGIGHSDAGMAAFAVEWLFGHPPVAGKESNHVRVLFGGDTSYGESYQEDYAKKGGVNVLTEKGYDYPIAQLSRLLAAVDYRIINLETPLTTHHDSALKTKDYLHYSDPVKLPDEFKRYGPIAFSLANNHTLDQGTEGLSDTFVALKASGIRWFGAGNTLAEAAQPLVQKLSIGNASVTLAVFGAFEYRKDYDENYKFYARADRPGTAPVDLASIRAAIADLRRKAPDAFVVYFVHWGENYLWKHAVQTATARGLREAGVDLVVGSGAHMMQEVVHDGKGWIFYCVGNFMFNARGRYAANHAAPFSVPLVVDFSMQDGRLQTGLRVYPIISDNVITAYQPRFATETELSAIDALLAEKSGWNAAARAAVKRGHDDVGNYLEFLTPQASAK